MGGGRRSGTSPGTLGSVIFFCNHATFKECFDQLVFGLPLAHFSCVKNVQPGMPLFLFNTSDRKLHGIFEATSAGALNINPNGWTTNGGKTRYPAQVRVRVKQLCRSLPENAFKHVITYYSGAHFEFELSHEQTEALIYLFVNLPPKTSDFQANPQAMIPNARKKGVTEALKLQREEEQDDWKELWNNAEAYATPLKSPFPTFVSMELQDLNATPEPGEDVETGAESSAGANPELVRTETGEKELHVKEQCSYKPLMLDSKSNMLPPNPDIQSHAQGDIGSIGEEQVKTDQMQKQGWAQEKDEICATSSSKFSENGLPEWEKLARERCPQEQTMLREDHERLQESLKGMDSSVEKCVLLHLGLCAAALAQMRQDNSELKQVLGEAYAESSREVEQLRQRNAVLEDTQVQMASELQFLKSELARVSQRLEDLSQGCRLVGDNFLTGNSLSESNSKLQQSSLNVYLLGGYDGNAWLGSVDVFRPLENSLRPAAPMLAARSHAAATVLMGQIYIFGGGNGGSCLETVETYNSRTNEWSACAPMSLKRGSLAGATVGDRVFALGGGNGRFSFSDVEYYDADLGSWINSTSMLHKRFCLAASELDGALYAIGGYDDNNYLKSVERFDPREALWTPVAPMNKKRASLSAAVLGGKIYAIGGFDGSDILNSFEVYEPRGNCWLEMAGTVLNTSLTTTNMNLNLSADNTINEQQMHTSRAYGAVAAIGDRLYMLGGLGRNTCLDSVECYRQSTGWEVVQSDVLGKRCFLAGAVLE